jgi:hypothetical protein
MPQNGAKTTTMLTMVAAPFSPFWKKKSFLGGRVNQAVHSHRETRFRHPSVSLAFRFNRSL